MVEGNKKYNLKEAIPYNGARPMYQIEDLDDKETIKNIILDTVEWLPKKKNK